MELNWSYVLILPVAIGALVVALHLVWWERRLLGWWQDRLGPNRVGPFGVLQAAADLVKLLTKDDWLPPFGDRVFFIMAPAIVVGSMLMAFVIVPLGPDLYVADSNIAVLFFLAMSSLAVYGVLLGGLSSNNKYAMLGGLRTAAQMLTYEVFMGLSLMGVVIHAGSFSLVDIVESQRGMWHVLPQFLGLAIFLLAGLAESHRLPFDLPEAEHELAAGFHTEYSGMKFGFLLAGEYLAMMLISALVVTLFLGGWLGPGFLPPVVWFGLKTALVVNFFILLRAAIPRPRYDQLMSLGWKVLLPLSLVNLLATGAIALAAAD